MGEAKHKQPFVSHFSDILSYSWRSLLSHPWILSYLFISNVLFLFLFRYYQQPLLMKIDYTLQLLSSMLQTIVQSIDTPGFIASVKQTTLTGVIFNDALVKQLLSDLVILFMLLAIVVYVVYTFFQSTSVRTIGWMILDEKPYTLWSFIKLNSLWFILYYLLRLIILAADTIYSFVIGGKLSVLSDLSLLYVVMHIVLFYLVFISYTFVGENSAWGSIKRSISAGLFTIKSFKYYLLNYIPFALFIIPFTHDNVIVPLLNSVLVLGVVGSAIQLIFLFFMYILFVANVYTITQEVVKSN